MADLKNTTNIDTLAVQPGLITDLNPSFQKQNYSYARNAIRNSKDGDLGTISNEPSNSLCITTKEDIVGVVDLPDDKVMIFSGKGEIGIADLSTCTYNKLLYLDCLNFSTSYPVTGIAKKDFNKGIVVTFTDNNNPVRRLEVDKIDNITCDDMLLFKKIKQPCIKVEKGIIGNMPNGSYSVAMAYTVNGQTFSDYYSVTNRIILNSDTQSNSLDIEISDLDEEFDKYNIVVIGNYVDPVTRKATKSIKVIGEYPTSIKRISVSDFLSPSYIDITNEMFITRKRVWRKAGIIASNSNILMLADLTAREEEDYQLKAFSIKSEYVVKQVPVDYYENDGKDVGYYRDENYDFYIQGIYNTGEETDRFHIPGPLPTGKDLSNVSGDDVWEYDKQFDDCERPETVKYWQIYNTAGKMNREDNPFLCGERVIGYGNMGYWASTEKYPNNPYLYGEWSNTPYRFHKMPDEEKVPRYSIVDGKKYINILGIRFSNIPKFTNPDIVGYKITRSDRKGGNGTVVARGLLTNMRSYYDDTIKQDIYYSNYTVNDLREDSYLSSKQTYFRNNKEHDYKPLTDYHNNKFSFYSPHILFEPRYSLGNEMKIECEEVAKITGSFEKVYNHPRQKLINQFSFWLAAAVGSIQATLTLLGRIEIKSRSEGDLSITGGVRKDIESADIKIETVDDLISLDINKIIAAVTAAVVALDPTKIQTIISLLQTVLTSITALGVKTGYSIFAGLAKAEQILDTIYDLTGYTDYVYQYNSHAVFEQSIQRGIGQKRRRLMRNAVFVPSQNITVDNLLINNNNRERWAYIHLNKDILPPSIEDNSRQTIGDFKICNDVNKQVTSTGSVLYATSKVTNPNQYGRLGSAPLVSIHNCPLTSSTTPILFGGDCIIAPFRFLKKMAFFSQSLDSANTPFPDGTEFDYRLYRNIAYPRYWADFTKYSFSSILIRDTLSKNKFLRTSTSKHNLDCKRRKDEGSVSRIDDAYMYLYNNCVMDFICEADYNPNFRDDEGAFYGRRNTNLSLIFRSDKLREEEIFSINRVYSDIYTTELFSLKQREDYDPNKALPVHQNNSIIYSLSSFNLQEVDNWQYFLPANFFSFREMDFGDLSSIHKLDQDRMLFLFSKSSPFILPGRSVLQLSNQTVTIGDAGLFAQDPREVMPTDDNYGSSTSRYAFSNTHMGRFYPSKKQGRILSFTESLEDISRAGMSFWCNNYMPIFLYKYFPSYKESENPLSGVGYLTTFDSKYEMLYICKRDFSPKKEYINDIRWSEEEKKFFYKNIPISLRDSKYFNDISFTLSFSASDKKFISWHDWHPDWVIQRDNHFCTVKGNGIWKHNEKYDSYCNFYGKDYPFEVEYVSTSGQTVETVRSIEYLLESYQYKNFGRDRFHVLNHNFDSMYVYNSEQMSPLLDLYLSKDPEANLDYPKKNQIGYDVLFSKEENKYRVNQFWDATRDRGEFTSSAYHLLSTDESGYKQVINTLAIDLDKPEDQRKKFRHYYNRFRLIKRVSGDKKMIVKLLNVKKQISPR